ncbi:COR domain-containing protein [Neolewinella lacunae]|nr:COR domain-containing protein [Neolewinella lacunae]MDN3633287.1 COR domain-containing protein [Neolewinella lacunae]
MDGIYIYNNPLTNPSLEIAQQGTKAVLKYWAEQDRLGTQKAYEGRLMLLGRGKVGKTSLLYKLKDPDCQLRPDEPQTHGINIWRDWRFSVPQTNAEYRASVWDFGGQDVQHLTHQYFLTPGTVYVVVVNKRGSNTQDEYANLDYWFRIITALGCNPGQKARVLVVHNRFSGDGTATGIDLAELQQRYADSLAIDFHTVNLNEDVGALADLRQKIQSALLQLPEVGRDIIKGWPDVRAALGAWRHKRRITYDTYADLCEEHGIESEEGQLLLSRYLGRLGELIHYEGRNLLSNNVLLDIDWITTAVYGVTQNQAFIDNQGRFSRAEIIAVWKANGVTRSTDHNLMLELLQVDAFELCWITQGGDFLTPSLFSAKAAAAREVRSDLGLRFSADYLPEGLIGQLIVRLHALAEGEAYWRSGIYLKDPETNCRALVRQPVASNYLEITVEGAAPQNYAFLRRIRQELDTVIDRSFSRIQFTRSIPCPCSTCRQPNREQHYFPHTLLQQLLQDGKAEAYCQYGDATPIAVLLEGFKQLEKQSPMSFAERVRQLVSDDRIDEALELLNEQYPSDAVALISRDYRALLDNKIGGLLSGKEERRVSAQIASRLLAYVSNLPQQSRERQQPTTTEAVLLKQSAQLDRIEATGKDTNQKVTALGQILLHIGQEVESTRGDLFVSRQEERQFMRKLEETVEQLPAPQQPGEAWYARPAKAKIKIALDLLAFVPGMSLKWEKELSTDGARVPRSWGEFKGWFFGG